MRKERGAGTKPKGPYGPPMGGWPYSLWGLVQNEDMKPLVIKNY